jgi:DNA-binding beta-propeller fold protein YncE
MTSVHRVASIAFLSFASALTATAQPGFQAIVQNAPKLALEATEFIIHAPHAAWALGSVSWIAADRNGLVYLLQRNQSEDAILVVDRSGRIVRSWGKGMFTKAHAIRIDPLGNIWTTDAATSMVYKFTPDGRKLMEISVDKRPPVCIDNFCGTTDLAFAPNGHIFVTDGYSNNRVLEYGADGKKLREWGGSGTGPGQFHLPHSIRIDDKGIIYVSDRENGRIQRFDLTGKYLGEWSHLGRVYSLEIVGDILWVVTQALELPNTAPGWLLKLDRTSGKVLGYADVNSGHGMVALANGELIIALGPDLMAPWWYRPIR